MSETAVGATRAVASVHPLPRRRVPLGDLDRPAAVFARLGPNWFASVMGTGIVATAAATLPGHWPGLRGFADGVWVLSAVWLFILASAEVVAWTRYPGAARGYARDPVLVQFCGAPPMALLTVGAGALLLGPSLVGAHAAITIDPVLWALGTVTGRPWRLARPPLPSPGQHGRGQPSSLVNGGRDRLYRQPEAGLPPRLSSGRTAVALAVFVSRHSGRARTQVGDLPQYACRLRRGC
jgi:hypothetical protein